MFVRARLGSALLVSLSGCFASGYAQGERADTLGDEDGGARRSQDGGQAHTDATPGEPTCESPDCTAHTCDEDGLLCQLACDTDEDPCFFDCDGVKLLCQPACTAGSTCFVTCLDANCSTSCPAGAKCDIDCSFAQNCATECAADSRCDIDCTGAGHCTDLACKPGAHCSLTCGDGEGPSDTCKFSECENGFTCPDGTLTCNLNECP